MTFHDAGTTWFLAQLKPNSAQIANKNLGRQVSGRFCQWKRKRVSATANS